MKLDEQTRKILHVDMDAYYASVEQRDDPSLKGKPIAVGGNEKRGVITTASYAARKFGVGSAMPGYMAKQKCPELIFVKPRFEVYSEISHQIRDIFREYTDLIEPLSLDEAYLDITTNKKEISLATEVADMIQQQIFDSLNLTCSIGVSYCKFLAKIASDLKKPNGITVIKPHQAIKFIEQLPVKKFFGVGKVTAEKMNKLDIHTGLDLKSKDRHFLITHFGKSGKHYYDIVRGIDNRPVVSHRERKSLAVERTLEENLSAKADIVQTCEVIIDKLVARLDKHKSYGRTLTLKIKRADFSIINRSKSLKALYDNKDIIHAETIKLIDQNFDTFGEIRLIGLSISNFNNSEDEPDQSQMEIDFNDEDA